MSTVWLGWDNVEALAKDFSDHYDVVGQSIVDELKDANILIAWYGQGSYDGTSEVYFEKNGKLFKNYASHCSCYGLERQWSPEEVTWEELAKEALQETNEGHYPFYTSDEDQKSFILRSMIRDHGFDLPVLTWEEKLQKVN